MWCGIVCCICHFIHVIFYAISLVYCTDVYTLCVCVCVSTCVCYCVCVCMIYVCMLLHM